MEMTLEKYLHTSFTPDAEYVDGQIEERRHGDEPHSAWHMAIMYWFSQNQDAWNIRVRPSLRIQVSPTRIRVPDVSILDAVFDAEQIPTKPPIAAFEIWSPEDSVYRLLRKLDDYEGMLVPHIWFIDPADQVWMRFEFGRLVERDTFTIPNRGISFEMSEIDRLVR